MFLKRVLPFFFLGLLVGCKQVVFLENKASKDYLEGNLNYSDDARLSTNKLDGLLFLVDATSYVRSQNSTHTVVMFLILDSDSGQEIVFEELVIADDQKISLFGTLIDRDLKPKRLNSSSRIFRSRARVEFDIDNPNEILDSENLALKIQYIQNGVRKLIDIDLSVRKERVSKT